MNDINKLIISPAPHFTKKGNTTQSIMLHVLIALMPVAVAATVIFGYLVIINVIFCVIFCMGFELLYNMLIKKKWNKEGLKDNSAWDFSSAVTGVILALNLPTSLDIWGLNITGEMDKATGIIPVYFSGDTIIACFLGSLMAIVLVKMLFGGIGKNFANPAMVGRIFLFVAFAAAFSNIYTEIGTNGNMLQGITEATWLGEKFIVGETATVLNTNIPMLDMFLGKVGTAAVGETCVIAIVIGYVYLSVVKVIDFRIPLIVIVSTLVFVLFFDGFLKYSIHNAALAEGAAKLTNPLKGFKDYLKFIGMHALSGGLFFGAVFMATDYSTSPKTFWGKVVFACGIGFFTAVMRTWTNMPEGMSFAIIIMNIITPLIDKMIKPRPFGAAFEPKTKGQTVNAKAGGGK